MAEPIKPTLVTITLPVKDLAAATKFYSDLLGHGPDSEPAPGNAEFQLGQDVWLMLSEDDAEAAEAGAKVLLGVESLSGALAKLRDMGVTPGEVQEIEGALSWSDFRGPESHRLTFVELKG
ncbi:VOC family protein [Nonomuraea sp. SYSU D8015]|uniref:VOC family protein n=1 Tax=Nonomuraea sp. SYSU D8015 TaxID=2593644 RepID=UPI001660EED1|nr:VOC family protein [Nonomuraea sp. SYSU D8015]